MTPALHIMTPQNRPASPLACAVHEANLCVGVGHTLLSQTSIKGALDRLHDSDESADVHRDL